MREYYVCGGGVVNGAGYFWNPGSEDFDQHLKIVGVKLKTGKRLSWKQVKKLAVKEGKAEGRAIVFNGEKFEVEPHQSSIFPAPLPVKDLKYVGGRWKIGDKKVAAKLVHTILYEAERSRRFELCLRDNYENNYCAEMLLVTERVAIAFFKQDHLVYLFKRKHASWTSTIINDRALFKIVSCTRDKMKITIVGFGVLSPLAYTTNLKTNKSQILPPEITRLLIEKSK